MEIGRFVRLVVLAGLSCAGLGYAYQEFAFNIAFSGLRDFQSQALRILPSYLEDQRQLESIDVFQVATQGTDAGTVLNGVVPWNADGQQLDTRALASAHAVEIPKEWYEKFRDDAQWPMWHGQGSYQRVDLKWMQDLHRFDFWDLENAPPVRQALELARLQKKTLAEYMDHAPEPDADFLVTLGKIRLLQGLQSRNLTPVFLQVRQLARLAYSMETAHGARINLALLRAERVAFEYALSHRMIPDTYWVAPSEQTLKRVERVFTAAPAFFNPLIPAGAFSQTLDAGAAKTGQCVAIREGTRAIASVDRALSRHIPGEKDFSSTLGSFKNLALNKANGCRLPVVRAYWENPDSFPGWTFAGAWEKARAEDAGLNYTLALLSARIPYLRKAGALSVLLRLPDPFRAYE